MKKFLLSLVMVSTLTMLNGRELVDKIVARVNGVNIMYSSLQVPHIATGAAPTLQDAITEELWVQRAVKREVQATEEDVDRQVLVMKQSSSLMGLSDAEVSNKLEAELGLDLEAYRVSVKRVLSAMAVKNRELWERCDVRPYEIRQHFENRPEYTKSRYLLRVATLSDTQAEQWSGLKQNKEALNWESLDWIEQKDLASHLSVVSSMREGEYSEPIKTFGGHIVVNVRKAEKARKRTFDERYAEIERLLKEKKMNRAAVEMEKDLYADAVIIKL